MAKKDTSDALFELVLSNGKSKTFSNGNDLYEWARVNRPNWRYELSRESDKDSVQENN